MKGKVALVRDVQSYLDFFVLLAINMFLISLIYFFEINAFWSEALLITLRSTCSLPKPSLLFPYQFVFDQHITYCLEITIFLPETLFIVYCFEVNQFLVNILLVALRSAGFYSEALEINMFLVRNIAYCFEVNQFLVKILLIA